MTRYKEGDWITFRGHEGYMVEKKILEVRPDGKLVVGDHDNDPNVQTIKQDSVSNKIVG